MRTSRDSASDPTAAAAHGARVYTVPPGTPFLEAIARAILAGDLPSPGGRAPNPLDLPRITLLLPTRRAARAAQEAFLKAGGGRAMLLPRIRPIAQADEDLDLLSGLTAADTPDAAALDLPPAVSEIERRLVLTVLIRAWSKAKQAPAAEDVELAALSGAAGDSPSKAANLAADLARLMDMVETENVDLSGLAALVPEEYSEHWQQTIEFLRIVTDTWPGYLREKGLLSPAGRRNAAILAEARRLASTPPEGPVVVAGVTGSIPATVELMRAVAALPQGAIVLPGLDSHLDEESWQRIVPHHPEHPQFGLKALIDRLGIDRGRVRELAGAAADARRRNRAALIAEAMRPSETTGRWRDFAQGADRDALRAALDGVSLIETPSAQDEAEVVALILREAAETPGRTAALVSRDRLLARRVAVRLEAWGIRVDDSAGRPFAKTVPGTFLELVIDAAARNFAPAATMALLKHPLTRLGLDAFPVRRAARALEIAVFRDVYLGRGLDGIADALEHAQAAVTARERRGAAVRRLRESDWQEAHDLVARLTAACAPLTALYDDGGKHALRDLTAAHVAVAEAIARLPEADAGDSGPPLWREEAGLVAATFFSGLADPTLPAPDIRAADYADLYRSLITGLNVRPRVAVHPRIFIWGPFEARLQQTDVMVLGSLNDGTWPEAADPGPWLNRPMRVELGLPSPEETIGYAAHDFTSLVGSARVYLTRAQKVDGVPTVPSRWLMRLEALLAGLEIADALAPSEPWLGWARARDHASERIRIKAPEPRPPLAQRPRQLSVTRIEDWLANPYAIFARNILKLDKLPALGADPNAALRGTIVHAIMKGFAQRFPDALPADPQRELEAIAREVISRYDSHARVAAFWVPRFARFAAWFAETEPERRDGVERTVAEVTGALVLGAPGGAFTLSARVDRIDVSGGSIVITDYKTGAPPNDKVIRAGFAPQLPLEAAIALGEAGFAGVACASVTALRYIRATGGEPPGEERTVQCGDIARLAADAVASLARLITRFDDPATPYKALRRSRFTYDYDDYAHLARVGEWSAVSEPEDEPA